MPDTAFKRHLARIGLPPEPGNEAGPGLVLQHVQMQATRRRTPVVDAVSILAPQRPAEIEVVAEGVVEKYVLRKGDIALAPPFFDAEVTIGPLDGVVGYVHRPIIAAIAAVIDPASNGQVTFRRAPQTRDPLLSSLAFELCDHIERGPPDDRLYVEALATAFLARIVKRYAVQPSEARAWGKTTGDVRVKRTIAFLETRLADDVGLTETARHVGLSATQLADIFKAATGETVASFVRRRRLERARELLTATNLTVAEVAERVGYASAPHFNVAFKAMFGIAPGTYRKGKRSHVR